MPLNSRLVWTFAGALSILVLISLKTPCSAVEYTGSLFQSKNEPGEEPGRWWRKLLSGLDSELI